MDDKMLLDAIGQMMDDKIDHLEKRYGDKLAQQEKRIMKGVQAIIETDVIEC